MDNNELLNTIDKSEEDESVAESKSESMESAKVSDEAAQELTSVAENAMTTAVELENVAMKQAESEAPAEYVAEYQPNESHESAEEVQNEYEGVYRAEEVQQAEYSAVVKKEEVEKPVKEKKHRSIGKIFGRICVLVASGILFGLCAAVAFGVVNYYTAKEEPAVDTEVFEKEALKTQIESDIIAKIQEMNNNDEFDTGAVIDALASSDEGVMLTDVSGVVADVMPSVVSIINNFTVTRYFWGSQYSEEAEASGSGIIIGENDKELIIATNNHVIDNADKIRVIFIDNTEAEAHIKGADADMDIAVIAVSKDSLEKSTAAAISIATLGDSDKLKVGEPAIAIGNALGYGQSVTTGVISALNRELEISEGEFSQGFIQTDAAINPGNSGGALLNVNGEVIGINSNKIGGSTVEGMGYAIPISKALPIIDDLKTKKTKSTVAEDNRGYLGISGRGVSAEMAELYDFPQGVYVYDVYPGTGAEKANLRKGDIITKFEGTTLDSMEKLQGLLAYYEAGDTVKLTIERLDEGGKYQPTEVSIQLVDESMLPSE